MLFGFFRYFINFLLDTTLGLLIIWACLKLSSVFVKLKGWRSLQFGEYGKIIFDYRKYALSQGNLIFESLI